MLLPGCGVAAAAPVRLLVLIKAIIGLLSRAESGEWLLARDLEDVTLAELYEACHLRVPISEAHLPCRDDSLGIAASNALDELRIPLRALLKRRVSGLFEATPAEKP